MRRGLLGFDLSRCSGCQACVVACQEKNHMAADAASFRSVVRLEEGDGGSARLGFVSLACLHCLPAPCLAVCPSGALRRPRPDGPVLVERNLCVGCKACLGVCPVEAPRFADGRHMTKCDLCADWLEQGREPACVRVCPTRALSLLQG